jgi:hypothetical protein
MAVIKENLRFSGLLLSQLLVVMLIANLISGCNKCEPYRSSGNLSESTKALIPNNMGDTLKFTDGTGKRYFLHCTAKVVKSNGYSNTGHSQPCDDMFISWEYLQADFSGNLLSDKGDSINFRVIYGEPHYDETYIINSCNSNQGGSPYRLKFSSSNATQWLDGYLQDVNSPRIKNYLFKQQITLNGRQFQNVNIQSVSNPGPETTCPATNAPLVAIDSVYYNIQYGLIRLTTVGGKKYQRVL